LTTVSLPSPITSSSSSSSSYKGAVPCLIQMLNSGKGAIMTPALRTLGNIVSGDDSQTQHVVNSNVLPGIIIKSVIIILTIINIIIALVPLLSNAKKNIRKEVTTFHPITMTPPNQHHY